MAPFRSWLYLLLGLAPTYLYGKHFHESQGRKKLINCKSKFEKIIFCRQESKRFMELPLIQNQQLKSANK